MRRFLLLAAAAALACGSEGPKLGALHFLAPASVTAGAPLTVTLSTVDVRNAPFAYSGVIEIRDGATAVGQIDMGGGAQADGALTLSTAGDRTLTAIAGAVQASVHVSVSAAAAAAAAVASGDAQQAVAGSALSAPLAVRISDAFGNAVAGEQVTWRVIAGHGSVAAASSTSGADGIASTTARLDRIAGPQQFQATWGAVALTFSASGTAGPAAALVASSGDDQAGSPGAALALPFKVHATDQFGNIVPSPALSWQPGVAGDSVVSQPSDAEGTAIATATLGTTAGAHTFVGTLSPGATVTFSATTFHLSYVDPLAGTGKVRLVANAASTPAVAVLDLVSGASPMTAFSAGMNLPLDATRARLDASPLVPGTALPPGAGPVAAGAALPLSGPLKNTLVSVQSQKAAGFGAVPNDSAIAPGAVLYTLRIHIRGTAAAGTVFDGAALPASFRAAVRNKAGTDVATASDFAIGKLVVGP